MSAPILSYEFKSLLNKIKEETVKEFPIQVISLNYLVYTILNMKSHEATSWLSSIMISSTIEELRMIAINKMTTDSSKSVQVMPESVKFSKEYDDMAERVSNNGELIVSSSAMFVDIVSNDDDYKRFFAKNGFTPEMVANGIMNGHGDMNVVNFKSDEQKPVEEKKKKKVKTKKVTKKDIDDGEKLLGNGVRLIPEDNNIIETSSVNMVREAGKDMYGEYVGFDKVIDSIFDILGKCDKNTVAVVGDRGVGKTSLIKNLAQRLYAQDCPKQFKNMYLVRYDDHISSVLINEMNKSNKYICCIEDIERMFVSKDVEQQNMAVLRELMNAKNVCTIFTANDTAYTKSIESKPEFARYIQKIALEGLSDEDMFTAVKNGSKRFSEYHSVNISDDCVKTSIRLAKNYITNERLPSSALDLLDASCTYTRLHQQEPTEIVNLKLKLNDIGVKKSMISNSSNAEAFDEKDKLIREEIDIKKKLTTLENKHNEKFVDLTDNDIRQALSAKTNIPMSELDDDDKTKLKTLKDNLMSVVIGQDETIETVCRAVRRQRVGLSNPYKPCVMMFVGNTGTGKTFIAKRLAYEMFGDEKNIVRLDMSEYSDKTSVTKLYGSAPGYVGYEDGGILTEAIKKNNRCVLLLDEIEKANDEVFNVFLQVFDDGRLTDNKGNVVDFRNVIIIMTSNVGAKDVTDKIGRIGFGRHDEGMENNEIILKSIKKQFKPEFINRIDNICYFNKLSDESLKQIVRNEVKKVRKKVQDIGYDLADDILEGQLIEDIFAKIKEEAEYGARPILREIQFQLEDKLTDYIIDNSIEKGFVFTYENLK